MHSVTAYSTVTVVLVFAGQRRPLDVTPELLGSLVQIDLPELLEPASLGTALPHVDLGISHGCIRCTDLTGLPDRAPAFDPGILRHVTCAEIHVLDSVTRLASLFASLRTVSIGKLVRPEQIAEFGALHSLRRLTVGESTSEWGFWEPLEVRSPKSATRMSSWC